MDDLHFVSPLPDYIHLKCPVCYDTLTKESHIVDCCGHHFCARCIRSLTFQTCPLCKSRFKSVEDKNHLRALKTARVFCSNRSEGCEWEGELSELVGHLSKNGEIIELDICQYVEVSCAYDCGARLTRLLLQEHMAETCTKRLFVCEHCHEYSSTWEDVTTVHYDTCDQVPVECPNKCGDTVPRGSVDEHQTTACPLQVVECSMSSISCDWQGPRRDLDSHVRNEVGHHLMLLVTAKNKEVADLNSKVQTLQLAVGNLQAKVNKLEKERSEQLEGKQLQLDIPNDCKSESDDNDSIINGLPPKKSVVIASTDSCDSDVPSISPLTPSTPFDVISSSCPEVIDAPLDVLNVATDDEAGSLPYDIVAESSLEPVRCAKPITMFHNFRVREFEQKRSDDATETSVFFTSNPGYRMALVIYPNGYGGCQGSHVSVFVQILHGPKDDQLVWPFYGSLMVRVSSPFAMVEEVERVIESKDSPNECFGRPSNWGDSNEKWGIEDFLCHTRIPYYTDDDGSMLFEVIRATIPE